jgi:hypothetical protein
MFPSAYLPLLVAGCGCLRLEVLGAHPQEIGPGASCLARIQNDRGGYRRRHGALLSQAVQSEPT